MVFDLKSRPADPGPYEKEARRISDPVARLRYLRKHVPESVALPEVEAAGRELVPARPKWWRFGIATAALVVLAGGAVWWANRQPVEAPGRVVQSMPAPGPTPNHIWQVEVSQAEEV